MEALRVLPRRDDPLGLVEFPGIVAKSAHRHASQYQAQAAT